MAEIVVNLDKVSVSLAGRPIFTELSWELQQRQRIGLVGPNGAGKSTLLKLIATELAADGGNIFRQTGLTWGRLEQEPSLPAGRTVLAEALTAVPELAVLEADMARLEAKMGEPKVYSDADALEKVMRQHERLLVQYEQMGGPRYQSQVKESLSRLGMGAAQWDTLTDYLSGGQKKLVMLAKLLVQQPRLLLLDEPDNHLDIPAKRHLEQLIHQYDGCVVIISHDRYLLDEVATQIAELENGRLTLYQGNYTAYANERELRRLRQQQLYMAQQKEIARIEAAIKRFELWASLVVNERHIRQARSRQKMLDKMDKVEKVADAKRMTLDLQGWRGSNKVMELENVVKRFENGRFLYRGLSLTLWHGERV
ncbi:MAG: ABC-F family ATP-binding cassette domain-containing protein, partial [Ardenticatenaceae bacterium]|nr:ABC-F family ATP-binding cassette domain-containing protein [Ardenticatenaceae bacterium]